MFYNIKRWLPILLVQIPALGSYFILWDNQRSVSEIGIVLSQATGFSWIFIKEILTGTDEKVRPAIKKQAVGWLSGSIMRLSDWVSGFFRSLIPGPRRRYAQRMIDDNIIFNVRGLGLINSYRLNLNDVFVKLRISPTNPLKLNYDLLTTKNATRGLSIWNLLRATRPKRWEHTENRALAIIGPPGCGKTTLLQHITVTLAANRHKEYRSRPYLPILLFLRNHATTIQKEDLSLEELVERHLNNPREYKDLDLPPGWLAWQLNNRHCMVLLDGLDEVASMEQRKTIAAWVDRQIANYPRSRFIVTSRPQGYRDAPLSRADGLEVLPLKPGEVKEFIGKWYLANEIASSAGKVDTVVQRRAGSEADDLMRRLAQNPALNELTTNPLLLTMIAMVHRYHGALPGSRVELYNEICTVLLGRWRQAKGIQEGLRAEQKCSVLQPLAAHMMSTKTREIGTKEAVRIIAEPLRQVREDPEKAEQFLRDIRDSSGLLLEYEANVWGFAHLTFQEYLTTSYWKEQKIEQNWQTLVGESWWKETILLYTAQSDATPIMEACLKDGGLVAMTLATECLEEAHKLTPETSKAVLERLAGDLEATDQERRKLAAEVKLNLRLKNNFVALDDYASHEHDDRESSAKNKVIDSKYLTCAEYQLFLDEMRMENKFYQPDHWAQYVFPQGQGDAPISGIDANAAQMFCEWLTSKKGGSYKYRLPTSEEANMVRPTEGFKMALWCYDVTGPAITSLAGGKLTKIKQQLTIAARVPVIDIFNLNPDLAGALDNALDLVQDSALDLANTRDRFNAHALSRDLTQDLARDRVALHYFALGRYRGLARYLARDLASVVDMNPVIKAISQDKPEEALKLMRNHHKELGNNMMAMLLEDLLHCTLARDIMELRKLNLRYFRHLTEYAYYGYEEKIKDTRKKRRWWLKLSGQAPQPEEMLREKEKEILTLYWLLKITAAREEGKLEAWEGLRLVREKVDLEDV